MDTWKWCPFLKWRKMSFDLSNDAALRTNQRFRLKTPILMDFNSYIYDSWLRWYFYVPKITFFIKHQFEIWEKYTFFNRNLTFIQNSKRIETDAHFQSSSGVEIILMQISQSERGISLCKKNYEYSTLHFKRCFSLRKKSSVNENKIK